MGVRSFALTADGQRVQTLSEPRSPGSLLRVCSCSMLNGESGFVTNYLPTSLFNSSMIILTPSSILSGLTNETLIRKNLSRSSHFDK